MDKTATAALTVEEIHEAVRYWLKQVKGVEVDGEIVFRIEGRDAPDDWHARLPLIYELAGASFVVKQAHRSATREPFRAACGSRG